MNRYARVLWWDGREGLAVFDVLLHLRLEKPPRVDGLGQIEEIDFSSLGGMRWLREAGQAGRSMESWQVQCVEFALRRLVNRTLAEIT